MATPAPALPTPAASRTRDWARTAEPGSAFSGLGRGVRGGGGGGGGGGRGRSRGGRGRSGAGAASEGSTSKPATSTPEKSSVPSTSTTPTRPKGQGRKSSRPVVPTVVVGTSTSSAEQLNSKGSGNAAALKVNVPSLDDSLLRPQNRLVPHSAPPPSKDTPPHLADALVERVRAVAMDNRPTTPGSASHIDWAGDDDEGLPDLDDWGVTTGTSVGDKDEMISPIIVDGLKPLPEPVSKPPTPSGDAKDEHQQKLPQAAQASLHPSLPPKPVLGPTPNPPRSGRAKITASGKSVPPSTEGLVSQGSTMPAEPEPAVQQPGCQAGGETGGRKCGLGASIHAPALSNSLSAPSNLSTPPTQPRNFNPTHNRAHTSAPVNFNPRFSRSGASTPRGSYPGGQHARTHSSPPAGSVLSNHRSPHTRPVITGDAISRLARTIAAPSARTPPISASNI
ncbi:proline/serine-rich protein [Mycena galericulata]|nr:proline/serine-rich protein [Mycena galericulata]